MLTWGLGRAALGRGMLPGREPGVPPPPGSLWGVLLSSYSHGARLSGVVATGSRRPAHVPTHYPACVRAACPLDGQGDPNLWPRGPCAGQGVRPPRLRPCSSRGPGVRRQTCLCSDLEGPAVWESPRAGLGTPCGARAHQLRATFGDSELRVTVWLPAHVMVSGIT